MISSVFGDFVCLCVCLFFNYEHNKAYNICRLNVVYGLYIKYTYLNRRKASVKFYKLLHTLSAAFPFLQFFLFWRPPEPLHTLPPPGTSAEEACSWFHKATCACHHGTLLLTCHLFLLVLLGFWLSSDKFFQQLGGAKRRSPPGKHILVSQQRKQTRTGSRLGYCFYPMPSLGV